MHWLARHVDRQVCEDQACYFLGRCFLASYQTASSSEGFVETPLGDMRGVLGARTLLRVDAVGCM